MSVQCTTQEVAVLKRKHNLGKRNCITLQVFTVLVSPSAQFNFADLDEKQPKTWKIYLEKNKDLLLLPFLKKPLQNFIFFWGISCLLACVLFPRNPVALPRLTSAQRAKAVPQPRTSYLSQRAAAAGFQCKCSCCLHHPQGAGWDHPRHIWHSLHLGLSHLSQSLCRLSPAWKDPKPHNFFGRGLTLSWNPAFHPRFDVPAKCACTSQIRSWSEQEQTRTGWNELLFFPHCFTAWCSQAQDRGGNEKPEVYRVVSFNVNSSLQQLQALTYSYMQHNLAVYLSYAINNKLLNNYNKDPFPSPQWKVHRVISQSQKIIICRLLIQPLLFNVLEHSAEDKLVRRHWPVCKCQKSWQNTFQARNHCLVSHTNNKQLDVLRHHTFFFSSKDTHICCQQDCTPSFSQRTPTCEWELLLLWFSTYFPQGGNVELNKLRAAQNTSTLTPTRSTGTEQIRLLFEVCRDVAPSSIQWSPFHYTFGSTPNTR